MMRRRNVLPLLTGGLLGILSGRQGHAAIPAGDVYSVLGRIDHGDTIDEIAGDNPDIPREALEAAIVYARAHPLVVRPGGKPWLVAHDC